MFDIVGRENESGFNQFRTLQKGKHNRSSETDILFYHI